MATTIKESYLDLVGDRNHLTISRRREFTAYLQKRLERRALLEKYQDDKKTNSDISGYSKDFKKLDSQMEEYRNRSMNILKDIVALDEKVEAFEINHPEVCEEEIICC